MSLASLCGANPNILHANASPHSRHRNFGAGAGKRSRGAGATLFTPSRATRDTASPSVTSPPATNEKPRSIAVALATAMFLGIMLVVVATLREFALPERSREALVLLRSPLRDCLAWQLALVLRTMAGPLAADARDGGAPESQEPKGHASRELARGAFHRLRQGREDQTRGGDTGALWLAQRGAEVGQCPFRPRRRRRTSGRT